MPDPITHTPESPPAGPVIPVGIATKLGVVGSGILYLLSVLVPLLPDTGTGTGQHVSTLATVVLVATIAGRMLQSASSLFGGGTAPAATFPADGNDAIHEDDTSEPGAPAGAYRAARDL